MFDKKRMICILLAALFMLSLLVGCAGDGSSGADTSLGNSPNGAESTVPGATGYNDIPKTMVNAKISFVSHFDPGFSDATLPITRAKKAYEKMYGKDTVKVQIIAGDVYRDRLMAMLAGNEPPKIVQVDTSWMPAFAIQHILQPIDDLIGYEKMPFQGLVESMVWDGKHYVGNPNGVWGFFIWYNKTMFEKYGVKDPRAYYEEGDWTWANFLTAAQEMTSASTWGFATLYQNTLLRSIPEEFVKMNDNAAVDVTWKDPAVVEAMQFSQDMINKHKVWNPDMTYASLNFKKGKVAMSSNPIGFIEDYCKDFKDEVDCVPLPKRTKDSEHYSSGFGLFYGVGYDAKNTEAAQAFLRILAAEEAVNLANGIRTPLERKLNDQQLKMTRAISENANVFTDECFPSWLTSNYYSFWNDLLIENLPVATVMGQYEPILKNSIKNLFG